MKHFVLYDCILRQGDVHLAHFTNDGIESFSLTL